MPNELERIIGVYDQKNKGNLLFVMGGLHGNEPAGMKAIEQVFHLLEIEPLHNPNFKFNGRIIGLRGNLAAIRENKRFIVKDLNRQFTLENIERVFDAHSNLDSEDKELKEILTLIHQEIKNYQPEKVVVLDLHTTTAFGGIFSIATDEEESQRIAVELHAPVIRKLINGIQGTTLHYFNTENLGVETVAVTFESGQHNEDLSIKRAIAAITNCLRSIECVNAEDVENKHDKILIEYSKGLPKIADLLYCHSIEEGDNFVMKEGYKNFQKVSKGELLAHDKNGAIYCKEDGRILMPLYQKQGQDGFFIIKTVEVFSQGEELNLNYK